MTLSTKLFLRITLTLIACAAATGVLAALGAAGSFGGQVGATCAAAFGVVFSAWCARNKFNQTHARPAELLFACGLALTLLLALAAIWLPDALSALDGSRRTDDSRLGASAVAFYAASIVGSTVFSAWKVPTLRFTSRLGTAVVAMLLLLTLAGIWTRSDRCLGAAVLTAPFGLAMSLLLIGLGLEGRPWRWVGFGTAVVLLGWGQAKIAFPDGFWDAVWTDQPWYIAGCCLVAWTTYALVMARQALHPPQEWLRKAAFAVVGLTLATVAGLAFYGHESWFFMKLIAAGTILSACGTLTLLILSRFARPAETSAGQAITHVPLACPRCGERQSAPLGTSPCLRCRALLTVGYAAPLCGACHAPVDGVAGDACPQCGGFLPPRGVALPPTECG